MILPLSLSVLALAAFAYFAPLFYQASVYHFRGSHTLGWYSDFGPEYGPDGRPYFFYAYKVGTLTYGGRARYDDDNSGIYYRRVGDSIGVSYLREKPWISTIEPVEWNFRILRLTAVILVVAFISGIGVSGAALYSGHRKK
jgi:hypothetical protein